MLCVCCWKGGGVNTLTTRANEEAKLALQALSPGRAEGLIRAAALEEAAKWWDDTEARSAEAHAVYQAEAHRRGDVRHPDEYVDLSEETKEWDRVLVRWVAQTIRAGGTVPRTAALGAAAPATSNGPDFNTEDRMNILRLSEEELRLLESRIKTQSKVKIHVKEVRTTIETPSKSRQERRGATFEHKLLARELTQAQIAFQEEFRFHPKRRWRFDFLVDNFGIEIVGGLWMKRGGHSQGQAQLDDMEKFNHAALLGYRVLQFTPGQVKNETAIKMITRCHK
jgi:hypothetical protein